jgi:hypothetical protein
MSRHEIVYVGGSEGSPFVGRGEQVRQFKDVIERIGRQGPVSSNLFEWYGAPGIGKSRLMRELYDVARDAESMVSLVDCAKLPDLQKDPVGLLNLIVSDMRGCGMGGFDEFHKKLKAYQKLELPNEGVVEAYRKMDQETRLYQRPDWLNKKREVVIEFLKAVNVGHSETAPRVLLLDDLDKVDIDVLDWVEEWVINPLIQVRSTVVGVNAARPWRWKRPEVKRRLTSVGLSTLSKDETQKMMELTWSHPGVVPAILDNIYRITGGHPAALQAVKK